MAGFPPGRDGGMYTVDEYMSIYIRTHSASLLLIALAGLQGSKITLRLSMGK